MIGPDGMPVAAKAVAGKRCESIIAIVGAGGIIKSITGRSGETKTGTGRRSEIDIHNRITQATGTELGLSGSYEKQNEQAGKDKVPNARCTGHCNELKYKGTFFQLMVNQ